jgi:predicted lipoprotein with Yx(FWY)xxD motif
MKKSKISYFLTVPLLLLVLLLVACTGNGGGGDGTTDGATDVPGGGGEPGVTEEVPAEGPLPEIGVTPEAPADATAEAPADATAEPTTEAPAGATTEPAAETPVPGGEGGITLQVEENDQLGPILTDGDGMTLYMFDADQPGESACYDACAEAWPPVVIESDPEVEGEAVNTTLFGVIPRTDGQTQLTYNGHPLYYYATDEAPGDVQGHQVEGAGGLWTAISPEGEPVSATGQGG